MEYKNILLATDLISHEADPVAARTKEIAEKFKAQVSIVHVYEPTYTYRTPFETTALMEWEQELNEIAWEKLSLLGQKLNVPKERQFLEIGQPKYWILEIATKIAADLIILGSHGRHGLDLVILGSTANAVLHGAKCDVLAVRIQNNH